MDYCYKKLKSVSRWGLALVMLFAFNRVVNGQVKINEVRADDASTDDIEFIELIGIANTDITGYKIVHVNGNGGSEIFNHTIGSFTIPDDGITDVSANSLGFYVLGAGSFATGTDESISSSLQNGPDGIILLNASDEVIDAVSWGSAADVVNYSNLTTSGSTSADNYLHVTSSDDSGDNSLQAPNGVLADDGTGWTLAAATIGAINSGQTSGSIIIQSTVDPEPDNHVTSFTASGNYNRVNLTWTDATGANLPDAYLIKAHTTSLGSITAPVDGTAESNDTDFSDGEGVLNISHGDQSGSFSNLDESTTYYFKIYPYSNSGSDIDYKTDGTIPEATATTLLTPDIAINEILFDPAGDANGDGIISTSEDEFVEIVNYGSSELDISGWKVDEAAGTMITFPSNTILQAGQAVVIFEGGTPAGDFGNSIVLDGTFTLNNGGDDVIIKDDQNRTVTSHTYSSGGNDQSIVRDPAYTGSFVDHTGATGSNGAAFSPGTKIDGTAFYTPSVDLTGSEGFRMISVPNKESYTDFLAPVWTQGATTGADTDQGNPNVFTYNTSTDSWTGLTDLSGDIPAGSGFLLYLYADDNYDGSNDAFPKTLESVGMANTGEISPTLNSSADGFTLVGNPFSSTIDYDNTNNSDLSGSIYIWDPNSEAGDGGKNGETASGSWKTWNGSTGDITDGLITPFQGFFVENAASVTSPSITFGSASISTGGTLLGKTKNEAPLAVRLELSDEHISNSLWLNFSDEGTIQNRAKGDALELEPMSDNFVQLASRKADVLYDIAMLPLEMTEGYTLPIHLKASKTGTFTLKATDLNIPENLNLVFHDYEQGIEEVITEDFTYQIEISTAAKVAGGSVMERVASGNIALQATASSSDRYGISVEPNETTSNEAIDSNLPEQITLKQNYPNPFNPGTTIAFELTEATQVQLNVYNMLGQKVGELLNESRSAGSHNVYFDASNLTSGVYYYEMVVDGQRMTRKMTLLK